MVRKGERVLVLDRDEPIAELVPFARKKEGWAERMAREGRLILGTQDWASLKLTRTNIPWKKIQEALDDIREDSF
jgi:antitoxin (DNA-binding transcriptional repressor) of toxin-antitoxin stability system